MTAATVTADDSVRSYVDQAHKALEDSADGLLYLAERGITDESIEGFRLGWDEERYGVVIPYLSYLGDVQTVRIRHLNRTPKYMPVFRGLGSHLFNVGVLSHAEVVYICEGEFDCMTLVQRGLPATALAGVMNFKEPWAWLFAGKQVIVVMDGDAAGQDGADRLNRLLNRRADDIDVRELPHGKDITDLALAGELESFLGV